MRLRERCMAQCHDDITLPIADIKPIQKRRKIFPYLTDPRTDATQAETAGDRLLYR